MDSREHHKASKKKVREKTEGIEDKVPQFSVFSVASCLTFCAFTRIMPLRLVSRRFAFTLQERLHMSVFSAARTFGGILVPVILASGCSDASAKKAAPANLQATRDARSSAKGEIENDYPPGQIAKQGTAANHDSSVDPTTPERPIIYSALELTKIIDFTKLPAPKGATPDGHHLSSQLGKKVPAKVPDVAAFYIDKLAAMGWTTDEAAGKKTINDSEASVKLTNNGHVVSLSISPIEEKKPECMVSLVFHGNLDAQTLPRSEGAKLLYGSQTQTIYTTTNKVVAEAQWIPQSFSAEGWQRYVSAKRSEAESDQQKAFDFRKRGYALNVFIRTASAQGNQTNVQYAVHALAHELPAPPDAIGVEFDDDAWTLRCEIPSTMDAGADFYRQAMPAAGYKSLPGEKPQDKFVNLRFGTDASDVVLVQVAKKDDRTSKILIYGVSAAMMEKLRKDEEMRTKPAR